MTDETTEQEVFAQSQQAPPDVPETDTPDADTPSPEREALETRAREMGWLPQDQYHGPGEWRDADEFVKRGEELLPIVNATNRKLRNELLTSNSKISKLESALEAQRKSIETLKKVHEEATKREVEAAKRQLREELKAAKATGDIDAELAIQDRLDELRNAPTKAPDASEQAAPPESPKIDPEFAAFVADNPWVGNQGDTEDMIRTMRLNDVAKQLAANGETVKGRPFLDKCLAELQKRERAGRFTGSRVESSSPARVQSGRLFDKLPKEAKDACHADIENFVGPGKFCKTATEYEDYYAKVYENQ